MIDVAELTDSTNLIGNPQALRQRYLDDGVVFLRGVIDPELMAWGREKYREALTAEGLIDPAIEAPVWTGKKTDTWRPCDAIGTTVWHEVVKQPLLNEVMRDIFADDPVWIPIAAHRSGLPTGPVEEGQDIFAGRHQDGFYNEGMLFTICWMPVRDVAMDRGSFAVAPGTHHRGSLHDTSLPGNAIPREAIAEDAWRSASFRVGDVLIFNYLTAHTALPNPSDEIRMSLDVRAIPASAPQPVIGSVDRVEGRDVTIRTEDEGLVTVHLSEETLIRDMNPWPRIPLGEVEKIAYPGAHVMAMARTDRSVTVLRRNFY
ncbi:phytanoyl-CoA dioxygenase family protein [Novosphingobium sp. G106]|uniref:phytanoyl-CoA dioxygenase family protein n=1 Tax=Novosphingobium sp. G106 TaxID=2849500 RepID=UPI001C2D4A16|nr:phytanoyl-CoA dioxygenase family protein [Novosphingobium sp. G106]MBV1690550.1 phytanoyl-CoA dioxygenase family protein [Novosphingobium sp. G106]